VDCVLCGGCRAQRAAKEAKEAPAQPAPEKPRVDVKRFVKIGRPGYKVTKQRDPESGQQSLLFQVVLLVCLCKDCSLTQVQYT